MVIVFAFFTLAYVLGIFFLLWHWLQISTYPEQSDNSVTFSVIIAVRNEAANITNLLDDLSNQNYDLENFEVIVVNDASIDNTVELVKEFAGNSTLNIQLVNLEPSPDRVAHKKTAIEKGIKSANNKLIITTDGDCRVGPDWLKSFADCYTETSAKMICGPVTFFKECALFRQMQIVEFASLVGSGAACLEAGMPIMCNGANLCYEKAAFEEVGGFENTLHIPSGDDEHLMHKISEKYPGQLQFLKNRAAIVHTAAKTNFQEFKQQRIRWAGKWKYNSGGTSKLMAPTLFLYHALILIVFVLAVIGLADLKPVLVVWFIKLFSEAILLSLFLKGLGQKVNYLVIFLLQLVYPFYILYFGLVVNFSRKYTWKERLVNS